MDAAHEWTDEEFERLRDRLEAEYNEASEGVRKRFEAMMESFGRNNAEWQARVESGAVTEAEYRGWLERRATDHRIVMYTAESLANDAANADRKAMDLINNALPSVFAENANMAAFAIDKALGQDHSFDLYDEDTVRRLMMMGEDDQLIHEVIPIGPPRPNLQSLRVNLDAAKDVNWNRQKFTSAITQSVLQGESIPDAADRLARVLNMDMGMATRAARTAITGAENAGRIDSYKRAAAMGIKLEQEWVAALDSRTRPSHIDADGQHVPVGEKFRVGNSMLEYPADPHGDPSEVYNCRCTLIAWFPDSDQKAERWSNLPDGMTYDEWKHWKQPPAQSIEQLRSELQRRESELQNAVSLRKPATRMRDIYKEKMDDAQEELRKLEWAQSLDRAALEKQSMEIENRLFELVDGHDRIPSEVYDEYNQLLEAQLEIEKNLRAIDEYERAKRRFDDMAELYANEVASIGTSVQEYEAAQARIPSLIDDRNAAIRSLSEAQPFAPEVREKLGDEYADAMEALVNAASANHPEIADAYRMFSSQLHIVDSELQSGAFYRASRKGIFFNASETMAGSSYETPLETIFHEFGHLIDNVCMYGDKYMSTENGLYEVIRSDWVAFRNSVAREHGVKRERNAFAISILRDEMRGTENGSRVYGNVSDIIEGCTSVSYPLGIGHGASYHSSAQTPKEFVAEVFDSAMSNEAAYNQMKRIFPNATALVEELVRRLVS